MEAVTLAILMLALLGSVVLLISLARVGNRSVIATPLCFVVVAIIAWLLVNVSIVLAEPADPGFVALWGLPAAAAVAAGATAVAAALVTPRWRMSPAAWSLLSIHPTAMLLCAIVPAWRDAVYSIADDGSVAYGPLIYVHSVITISLISAALIRVTRARRRLPAIAVMSGWMLVIAWLAPTMGAAATVAGWVPPGTDLMSAGAALAAIMLWLGVLRPGLLELQPAARDWVFDKLPDAVFVVSPDGVIVDANNRAHELLDRVGAALPQRGGTLRDAFPQLGTVIDSGDSAGVEVELAGEDEPFIAWVSVTPIDRHGHVPLGRVVQIRDITATALQHRENESMRLALQAEASANASLRAELSEQVMRDPATGLRNRRFVGANVTAMMLRSSAEKAAFSVVMLDVDHFKNINDAHGHTVGDRVIVAVADAVVDSAPAAAEVVRFGGEEFLVVLPGLDTEDAFEVAENLRAACAALTVPTRDGNVTVRVSAGVATAGVLHEDADQLIDDADCALYAAKQGGRDRTEVWRPDEVPQEI